MQVLRIEYVADDFRSLLAADPSVHVCRLMALDGTSKADHWPDALDAVYIDEWHAPEFRSICYESRDLTFELFRLDSGP